LWIIGVIMAAVEIPPKELEIRDNIKEIGLTDVLFNVSSFFELVPLSYGVGFYRITLAGREGFPVG